VIAYSPVAFDPLNNGFPDVQVSLKRNPSGGYILLAANWKPYPVDVAYTVSLLGQSGNIRLLFDRNKTYKVEKGGFSDTIAAMDTRAYAITADIGATTPISICVNVKAHPEKTDPFYAAVALPDSGVPGKKNLIRNPGFEECSVPGMPDYNSMFNIPSERNKGWRIGDSRGVDLDIAVDTNKPFEGKNCLRMNAGKGSSFLRFYLDPMVEHPTQFVFSAWVRGNGTPGNKVQFFGPGTDGKKSYALTNEWQRIHQVITLPAPPHDGSYYGFYIRKGTVWIDAMQFEKGTEPTDYEK